MEGMLKVANKIFLGKLIGDFRIGYVLWKFAKEIGGFSSFGGGKKQKVQKTQLEIIVKVDVKFYTKDMKSVEK
jgi:O-glycosyl hydrolase